MSFGPAEERMLNIPLREDLIVRIHGLPFDITLAEAKKIAAVITAYADEEPEKPAGER